MISGYAYCALCVAIMLKQFNISVTCRRLLDIPFPSDLFVKTIQLGLVVTECPKLFDVRCYGKQICVS